MTRFRAHARVAAIGLLALLALAAPGRVAARDLVDYQRAIERALADLSGPTPDAARVASDLRAIETVSLSNGATTRPDLSATLAALETQPADVAAARDRLTSLLAALERAEARPELAASGDPGALLQQVLARDEFSSGSREPAKSLQERIQEAIVDGLSWLLLPIWEWLLGLIGVGDGGSGGLLQLVLGAAGLALVVMLVLWTIRSVGRTIGPSVARLPDRRPEDRLTSAEARADAERLFREGAFRAATRMLYLATLLRWEEAGRLRFDRTLTNREVLARANQQGDVVLIERLSPLVERFDRVWYGGADCGADDYARFERLAERAWEIA